MKERTELSMQLYHMLVKRGYPEVLCDLITRKLYRVGFASEADE